jgi:sialate O-acetylesterase
MVVQRELPFHLWGQAAPGETVRASFRGESRSAVADDLGRWSLHLPASAAGGPFTLTVSASNTIRHDDVWVGDVWVAAGQSNMEWPLVAADGAAAEIPRASHPEVRFLRATRVTSRFPLADVATEGWRVSSPETAPKFSAVAYFFAREIRERHPVPIGVIDASWGGAPLAAFTPLTTIASDPALQPAILHWSRMADRQAATLLRQATPEAAALRVHFDHAEGLTTRGGPVAGFEVAGADGRYVPAEARIEGTTVVVSSPEVAAPRSVRYGWADNPKVSLYNGADLPASPFRSAE